MDAHLDYVYALCQALHPGATESELSDLSVKTILNASQGNEKTFIENFCSEGATIADTMESEFITEIASLKKETSPVVMFIWNHDAVEAPLDALFKEAKYEENYRWVYAVTSDEVASSRNLHASINNQALFIPKECEKHLAFLTAIVSTDGFPPLALPPQVYRIAIVHGLVLEGTWSVLDHYFLFLANQVNCLFFSGTLNNQNNPLHYVNVLPRTLLKRQGNYFDIVAGGYAKLDQLHRLSERAEKRNKIIFHLPSIAYAQYEMPQLEAMIEQTVNSFPSYTISIRPYPNQLDYYQSLREKWNFESRVSWDLSASYNDNYKDARLLITSNSHSMRTFCLGTGRPAINVNFLSLRESERSAEEYGLTLYGMGAFLSAVKEMLDVDNYAYPGIANMYQNWANPGKSAKRLVQHLDSVSQGESDAEYRYRLFDEEYHETSPLDNVWQFVTSERRLTARAEAARLASIYFENFELAKHALMLRIQYLGNKQLERISGFPIDQISQFLKQYLELLPDDRESILHFETEVLPIICNALLSESTNVDFKYCVKLVRLKYSKAFLPASITPV